MVLPLLEQHMTSKYAASYAYTPETVKKVKVATGITMGYLIQEIGDSSEETRLVVVGGHSSRKEEWAPVADILFTQWKASGSGKTLKVLTFDNRGVGDSDAPCGIYSTSGMARDTLALLDVIGWGTVHVTDSSKITNAILAFLYPEQFLMSKNGEEDTIRDVFLKYHMDMMVTFKAPFPSGALGQTTAAMLHSVSTRKLHKLRDQGFPILIVGATLDKCITISHVLHLKKELASDHTRVVIYEDAGHGCLLQHLDELTGELLKVILSA